MRVITSHVSVTDGITPLIILSSWLHNVIDLKPFFCGSMHWHQHTNVLITILHSPMAGNETPSGHFR